MLLISSTLFAPACSKQVETYRETKTLANEAAAVRALHNIFKAQIIYSTMHPGEYGTFDQLVTEDVLDRRFAGASPRLEGYVFTMRLAPQSDAQPATFIINADPKQDEGAPSPASNARHLYIDSSGSVIHANATQPATAGDPPLQSE